MKKPDITLLGKQILPLVKRSQISGEEADRRNGGAGAWLEGERRQQYYTNAVNTMAKEMKKNNKEHDWYVFAIKVDNTYDLQTKSGYEQINLSRSDFRLIKNGKTF